MATPGRAKSPAMKLPMILPSTYKIETKVNQKKFLIMRGYSPTILVLPCIKAKQYKRISTIDPKEAFTTAPSASDPVWAVIDDTAIPIRYANGMTEINALQKITEKDDIPM
jgi:hypothetical protein